MHTIHFCLNKTYEHRFRMVFAGRKKILPFCRMSGLNPAKIRMKFQVASRLPSPAGCKKRKFAASVTQKLF